MVTYGIHQLSGAGCTSKGRGLVPERERPHLGGTRSDSDGLNLQRSALRQHRKTFTDETSTILLADKGLLKIVGNNSQLSLGSMFVDQKCSGFLFRTQRE